MLFCSHRESVISGHRSPWKKAMEKKVKIVLAEGHTILREGLRALLSSDSNLKIVGDAQDGLKAVDCVEKLDISIKTVEKHRESLMKNSISTMSRL